jgi:hypothetical protein
MFLTAMAERNDRDDKRYHYDDDYKNNRYEQSTYGPYPYASSYNLGHNYDSNSYDMASYDQQRYDNSYDKSSYGDYSEYKTKDKKYECRTGPFEGFFVSSVEFCDAKHKNFDKDDRKDRDKDNKTGPQGPPGPRGPPGQDGQDGTNGTDGRDGTNGTDGRDGTNGTNGTDFDPCVACLLDALVKLDSGAIVVNVTAEVNIAPGGSPVDLVNITVPLTIDIKVASLLQTALAENLNLTSNATIFEICAAINATSLNIDEVIDDLEGILTLLVDAQLELNTAELINELATILAGLGVPPGQIPDVITEFLAAIDETDIVAQISADVRASLELFERCLAQQDENGLAGIAPIVQGIQVPTVQSMNPTIEQYSQALNPTIQQNSQALPSQNPTIQQNSQALPSGDPMLQLSSTLSPIS